MARMRCDNCGSEAHNDDFYYLGLPPSEDAEEFAPSYDLCSPDCVARIAQRLALGERPQIYGE